MGKVHNMRWSCPYYTENNMTPEAINNLICCHFDPESCICELDEPWFDCEEYQHCYGVDDFEEE